MTDDSERRSKMTSNLNRLRAFQREKMDAATVNKSTMSVREMREMLGLKKTDSYWLIHRELFETILVNGRMRVVTESFEAWYANQIKYHKVDGPPPGKELKERSFSPQEIAEVLNGQSFSLMHYPMLSWPKSQHGSYMLHGHIHADENYNLQNREDGVLRRSDHLRQPEITTGT